MPSRWNVHIYPSFIENETRILKIVRSLKTSGVFAQIAIIGLWRTGLERREWLEEGIEIIRLESSLGRSLPGKFGKLVRGLGWFRAILRALKGRTVVCLNCHSVLVLPVGAWIKWWSRCTLIYDTHELETETVGTFGLRKVLLKWVEKALIGYADAVCVVNDAIAKWYESTYSLNIVYVVRNLPDRIRQPEGRTGALRRAIGLSPEDGRLYLYQGLLSRGRGIELLIDVFSRDVRGIHLVFMGYGPLVDTVCVASAKFPHIHLLPAVPPDHVREYTADADVGLCLIEGVCQSYYLCLPNKLFEYITSGVPAIVSAYPEMSRVIDCYGVGWKVDPEPVALSQLLDSIKSRDIQIKKQICLEVRDKLCWQKEEIALYAMYAALNFQCHQS
jgi:glycosyltransferase involved in cell wall biosynthesis